TRRTRLRQAAQVAVERLRAPQTMLTRDSQRLIGREALTGRTRACVEFLLIQRARRTPRRLYRAQRGHLARDDARFLRRARGGRLFLLRHERNGDGARER